MIDTNTEIRVPRFETVVADGAEYLGIAGLLVCKKDLAVPAECVDGEFVRFDPKHPERGQYFSFESAIIHARYQGLSVPTDDEWTAVMRGINSQIDPRRFGHWQKDVLVRTTLGLKLAGHWGACSAPSDAGSMGYYRTSVASAGEGAHYVLLAERELLPLADRGTLSSGFSVRCLKK